VITPAAAVIALGCGVAAVALIGGVRSWRPWLVAAFAAGGLAFPLTVFLASSIQALMAAVFGWGPDAMSMTLGAGTAAAAVTATVNEVFKLAAALLFWRAAGERSGVPLGAAAGAGFAAVGAYQVIHLALLARALPISSASSFVVSLAQQMAFVAANSASTGLAVLGAVPRDGRPRRAGVYLAAAILMQIVLLVCGLLYELKFYSIAAWTGLDLGVAAALVAVVLLLDRRVPADAALASAA
jgi:hypothetical protein